MLDFTDDYTYVATRKPTINNLDGVLHVHKFCPIQANETVQYRSCVESFVVHATIQVIAINVLYQAWRFLYGWSARRRRTHKT